MGSYPETSIDPVKPYKKNPRGYSWEFLVGVCRPVLQILTISKTKKCLFLHPFLDLAPKINTGFQTWPLENMSSLPRFTQLELKR